MVALTEEQVLSDAEELVTSIVTSLSAEHRSFEQEVEELESAKRVLIKASEIIWVMLATKKKPVSH